MGVGEELEWEKTWSGGRIQVGEELEWGLGISFTSPAITFIGCVKAMKVHGLRGGGSEEG